MLVLAGQVWGEHGAPVDSVIVAVSNYAAPTTHPVEPHRDPHRTLLTTFKPE